MSSQTRPSFFCSRPNGTLTPLIAMDELPTHVSVRGVSRTLTAGETQGMTSCGVAVPRAEPWIVDGLAPTARNAASKENLGELHNLLLRVLNEEHLPPQLRNAVKNILVRGLETGYPTEVAAPNAMAVAQAHAPAFNGNNGNFKHGFNNKKEYCSYWIRHGECDYQQQGCLYKHEMPTDPSMLEKLGLRDVPRWYREKFGVPSLLHSSYGNGNSRALNQPAMVDQPAQKAIQYTVPGDNAEITQHRGAGGRYKTPRGIGFQPGKPRGNPHWNKNGNRTGFAQTVASEKTPESSPSSSENSFDLANPMGKLDILPADGAATRPKPGIRALGCDHVIDDALPRRHIMDDDGTMPKLPRFKLPGGLTFPGPINGDISKPFFRTKSRRPFDFGSDGGVKIPAGSQPAPKNESNVEPQKSLLAELVANSEPIHPDEYLLDLGPIGEPLPLQCPDQGSPDSTESVQTRVLVGAQSLKKTDNN